MNKKDTLQIKFDLGLCTDTLMSMFFYFCINHKLGIIYFVLSLIVETILYNYKLSKLNESKGE